MEIHKRERSRAHKWNTLPTLQQHDPQNPSKEALPGDDSEDWGHRNRDENSCAIEFLDGRFYKVISSKSYSRAYTVCKSGGEVVAEQIYQQKQLAPVESLVRRH